MKKILTILFFSTFCFCSGVYNKDIRQKFESLKDKDYSEFYNINIVKRGSYEYVTYHNVEYKVKRNFFTKKISLMKDVSTMEEKDVPLSKTDIRSLERILKSFDKIGVLALSVDNNGNVLISIPWYQKCTYYFQKLSPYSTLKELNAEYYDYYEDNWYIDKRCGQ